MAIMWLPVIETDRQGGIWQRDGGRRNGGIRPEVYSALDRGGRLVVARRQVFEDDAFRGGRMVDGGEHIAVMLGNACLGWLSDGAAETVRECIESMRLEHLPCRLRPDPSGHWGKWFQCGIEVEILGV